MVRDRRWCTAYLDHDILVVSSRAGVCGGPYLVPDPKVVHPHMFFNCPRRVPHLFPVRGRVQRGDCAPHFSGIMDDGEYHRPGGLIYLGPSSSTILPIW